MIVVDASAILEVLLRASAAPEIEAEIFASGRTLHVPHLIDVEVTQVLRRYAATGSLDPQRAKAALSDLIDLPMRRYPHDFMLPRIWELRASLTAYDAAYVALAEALDAPLLTRDAKLAAAPGHHARIALV